MNEKPREEKPKPFQCPQCTGPSLSILMPEGYLCTNGHMTPHSPEEAERLADIHRDKANDYWLSQKPAAPQPKEERCRKKRGTSS